MSTHTPARELAPCPLTTVQVNDRPVSVRQALDRPAPEAAAVTVGLAVTLSVDHAAAALYGYNATPDELADPERVHALVAEAVLNGGCLELDVQRADTAALPPASEEAAYLALCRDAAAAVFTAPVPAQSGRPALVGVR